MPTRENEDRMELLQGALALLILRTVFPGRARGHAIAKAIECNSEDVLPVEQGSSENNRRVRCYRLTQKGRKQPIGAVER